MKVVTVASMLEQYRKEELDQLRILWSRMQQGATMTQLAKEMGRSRMELLEDFRQAGLIGNQADPDHAEIEAVAKRFKESWSKAVRESRWVGRRKIQGIAFS
jgi:hypothetical protein